jgi:high-affinity iron transporter
MTPMNRSYPGSNGHATLRRFLLVALALFAGFPVVVCGQSISAENPLSAVGDVARQSLQLLRSGGAAAAAAALSQFEPHWSAVEDGIRAENPSIYARIEVAASRAEAALAATPPDRARAVQALEGLVQAVNDYAIGRAPGAAARASGGISALVTLIRQVKEAIAVGDTRQAADLMQSFTDVWPLVEPEVKSRSARAYARVESEMTRATAFLLSDALSQPKSREPVDRILIELEGLSAAGSYSVWDAGLILLREGMEALLIIAALLAALKKAGAGSGTGWVWAGAGAGLLGSVILAVILGFAISSAMAGSAREGLEGMVGIASVLLMLTVGAWLHSRSSLKAWNGFVKDRVGTAIAAGRMGALFTLALFAVLREGVEAVVFYIGIAPGIGAVPLVAGIAGALLLLAAVGFLVMRFSVKLPLHWVFLAATILIYYLAFKITGTSVRALQSAGILPAHFADGLPSAGFLGMSPSWEAFVPQVVVLALVLAEVVMTEARRLGSRNRRA